MAWSRTLPPSASTVRGHEEKLYSDELGPGAQIGNYVVEELRSSGGFATVYRTKHVTLGRVAAVKVLHKDLATSSTMLQRFEQEAQAVNRIRHPNIVDIYEFGELPDGRPYFVMEWLDGHDLDDELRRRGPMPFGEVCAVLEELCAGLGAAHEQGIVHRDLKASNVIAVPSGSWYTFKLVDFGIAKLLDNSDDSGALTVTGTRLGTPSHMAPEQIQAKAVDARTDIYGLGVLLFHLLTGQLPFEGNTPAELEEKHLHVDPPRPSRLVAVPSVVDAVVARCMAKDPARRYANVGELLADLRRAEGAGDDAPPAPAATRTTTTSAIGVYFSSRILPDPPDSDLEDALDDLEELTDHARLALMQAGLIAVSEGVHGRLGVALLPEAAVESKAVRRRVLAAALSLRDTLESRAGRSPHVGFSIIVHVGPVVVRRRADECSFVGGELLAPTEWSGEGLPDSQVLATAGVLLDLADTFTVTPLAGHPRVFAVAGAP